MARKPGLSRLQHSLWDRLTNPELIRGEGVGVTASSEAERLKDEVRRDLEWLLNSRRTPIDIPDGLSDLTRSVLGYGLPDFTGLSAGNNAELETLQKTLEEAIRDFEPRLSSVEVTFNPLDQDKHRASLHYRIDGLLHLDPSPEPVAFSTVLDLGSKSFTVSREGS